MIRASEYGFVRRLSAVRGVPVAQWTERLPSKRGPECGVLMSVGRDTGRRVVSRSVGEANHLADEPFHDTRTRVREHRSSERSWPSRKWTAIKLTSNGMSPGVHLPRQPLAADGGRACPPSLVLWVQPVVAAQTSMLPQVAGQSVNGQGAGVTMWPASSDWARQSWIAGQTAAFLTSIQSPSP